MNIFKTNKELRKENNELKDKLRDLEANYRMLNILVSLYEKDRFVKTTEKDENKEIADAVRIIRGSK